MTYKQTNRTLFTIFISFVIVILYLLHRNGISVDPTTHHKDDSSVSSGNGFFSKVACQEDMEHIDEILNAEVDSIEDNRVLTSLFYGSITRPVQTACNKLTRMGRGKFYKGPIAWDGHKYVCEDDFASPERQQQQPCLVYSFGVGDDLSFEEAMASLGCLVHAFDHTINKLPQTQFETIYWEKLGLGAEDSDNLKTLKTLINKNGHKDSKIQYLKVDIEGAERTAMFDWINSGVLSNVQQIGVEFHQVPFHIRVYFDIVQRLYKLGFKTISWDQNQFTRKNGKSEDNLNEFFEIVLRKAEIPMCN